MPEPMETPLRVQSVERVPVGINAGDVICDDGSVWRLDGAFAEDGNGHPRFVETWREGTPIPGTLRAIQQARRAQEAQQEQEQEQAQQQVHAAHAAHPSPK